MALRVVEFFGYAPLDPAASQYVQHRWCPFVDQRCIKPGHGACSVQLLSMSDPVICCPNRMYGDDLRILTEIAHDAFGVGAELVTPGELTSRLRGQRVMGREVVAFGRYSGGELSLPRPPGASSGRNYYVDWILVKTDPQGGVSDLLAVEVQSIDTTGSYVSQAHAFFRQVPFVDGMGRSPGYSGAGMNWENVNKRILPQIIYKGHVLRREAKCSKGLYFVCPTQVYERILDRLGRRLHSYRPGPGTITFRSYGLTVHSGTGQPSPLVFENQFTTTVDQVALAFSAPMHLPPENVYEFAVTAALRP